MKNLTSKVYPYVGEKLYKHNIAKKFYEKLNLLSE